MLLYIVTFIANVMCVVIVFGQESVAQAPYRGFAEANYQDHLWRHDQSVRIQLDPHR